MMRPVKSAKDWLVICCLVMFGLMVVFVLAAIVLQFSISAPS
jgi:hypothetical protein